MVNSNEGLEQRVAAIEATLEHLATKADIESVKALIAERETTMLRWLMGMVAASALAVTIALVRTFMG
ncbi:MAG: hypothetical protein F4Y86_15225 [Gammaproteobacteria bacterium]|nr:hypothetical protein [Gammaproteobacteria bacterium]MYB36974.1 hypothetical protein [Gammaproteobacteria bacterium]